jgi:hypothetical protein
MVSEVIQEEIKQMSNGKEMCAIEAWTVDEWDQKQAEIARKTI